MDFNTNKKAIIFSRPVIYSSKGNPFFEDIALRNTKLAKQQIHQLNETLKFANGHIDHDSDTHEGKISPPRKLTNIKYIDNKNTVKENIYSIKPSDTESNTTQIAKHFLEDSTKNENFQISSKIDDQMKIKESQSENQTRPTQKIQNNQLPLIPEHQMENCEDFKYLKNKKETCENSIVTENKQETRDNTTSTVIEMMRTPLKTNNIAKDCVALARNAFRSGRTKNMDFRRKQLKGLLKFLECHKVDIEEALCKDLRKHTQETNMCEIELVANDLRHTLINFNNWAKPEKVEKRFVNILDGVYIQSDPYGVVLIIGAWNYPILLTLGPLIGALAGGNTVILKPSELVPATNKLLSEVLVNYLDTECFQIILGGVTETTRLLTEKFDYIFFTGSTKVGKIIHKAAAENLTPTTLELGGKCPLYLDDTVNIARAAKRIVWGRFLNSGQTCVAPDYLMCTKDVQEKFIDEAKKNLQKFYGDNIKESNCLSRIVNETHFNRLVKFIRTENIAVGGDFKKNQLIIAPTILSNVSAHDAVMEEEVFGPILPIIIIKDEKEAINFINSREKPLAIYVFSNSKKIQSIFLKNTSSGGICINDTISHIGTEGLPFGGVGGSGMGSYHGKAGFDTFTQKRAVLIKDFSFISEFALGLRYPPYSESKTKLVNFVLKRRRGLSLNFFRDCIIFFTGVSIVFLAQYIFHMVEITKSELE